MNATGVFALPPKFGNIDTRVVLMSQRSEFQIGSMVLLTASALVAGLAISVCLPMLQQQRPTPRGGVTSDPQQTLAAMAHSSRFVEFYPRPPVHDATAPPSRSQDAADSDEQPQGRTILTRVAARPEAKQEAPAQWNDSTQPPAGFTQDQTSVFPAPFGGNPIDPFTPAKKNHTPDDAADGFAATAPNDRSWRDAQNQSAANAEDRPSGDLLADVASRSQVHPAPVPQRPVPQRPVPQRTFQPSAAAPPVITEPRRAAPTTPSPPVARSLPPGSVYAPVTVTVDAGSLSDQMVRLEERMAALLTQRSGRAASSERQLGPTQADREREAQQLRIQQEAAQTIRAMEQEMKQLMAEFRELKSQTDQRLQELSSAADRANVAQQLMESYKRALEQEQRLRVARSAWSRETTASTPQIAPPPQTAELTAPAAPRTATSIHTPAPDAGPSEPAFSDPDSHPAAPPQTAITLPLPAAAAASNRATASTSAANHAASIAVPFPPASTEVRLPASESQKPKQPVPDTPQLQPVTEQQETPADNSASEFKPFSATGVALPVAPNSVPSSESTGSESSAAVAVRPAPPAGDTAPAAKVGFEHVYRFKMEDAEVAPAAVDEPNKRVCPDCGRVHGSEVRHVAATATDTSSQSVAASQPTASSRAAAARQVRRRPAARTPARSMELPRLAESQPDEFSDGTSTAMDRTSQRTAARGTNRHVLKAAGELPDEHGQPQRPSIVHRVTSAIRMLAR